MALHRGSSHRNLGAQTCSRTGRARDLERAPERLDAVSETPEAGPGSRVGAADAVVGHLYYDTRLRHGDLDASRGRLGVLRDVRQCLRDQVVRGRLDGLR